MTAPLSRQKGVVLLVFFLVLFVATASVLLSALNNRSTEQDQRRIQQMTDARQALIAYALAVPDIHNIGPGRLPCPDTNNDGQPDMPCNSNVPGRLPTAITLTAPSTFPISPIAAGTDQQFWYAVSPAYKRNPASILNANIAGQLSLDGAGDIVAVIIDAGPALAGQTRVNNTASNYLESSNAAGTTFVSSLPADPPSLNDRVITIRRAELMSVIAPRVAFEIKRILDADYVANGNSYPVDQTVFNTKINSGWLVTDQWRQNTTYSFSSANVATLRFAGCQMVFTLTNSPPDISSTPNRC